MSADTEVECPSCGTPFQSKGYRYDKHLIKCIPDRLHLLLKEIKSLETNKDPAIIRALLDFWISKLAQLAGMHGGRLEQTINNNGDFCQACGAFFKGCTATLGRGSATHDAHWASIRAKKNSKKRTYGTEEFDESKSIIIANPSKSNNHRPARL